MNRAPSAQTPHRIALLFNANKVYDREIITGIGHYLRSTRVAWDLFLEEDFRCRLAGIERFAGDGIIADFDDPAVADALRGSPLPVVAVGSSFEDPSHYPSDVPYIATDNEKLVSLAWTHLIGAGLQNFAMYSLPAAQENRWAQQRELAFEKLLRAEGLDAQIHRGLPTSAPVWNQSIEQLTEWLRALPKPVGVIAVTDGRARHVLQACLTAGIPVPEQVAIIGIDNDPLTRTLTRIPLSSVIQGTEEMGRTAAHLLHQMLRGARFPGQRILVPPVGINVLESTRHEPLSSPHVMRARHFIRQYACQGIKTEQVADYVGVSRSSLEEHFRRELQCTVHQEILRHKLDAAKALLASRDASSAEVAIRCGFTSLQYMYAVFKRELGCTPREYQEQVAPSSAN
ncbi:XylR family transcriptional regulator [Paraburkholderia caballeronis]|uniref:Transcriptional regulator, AraC family n=1 Tax=Paraburkholderia caballeronis TaxID=416943 RepID=A0A1H7MQ01_9BURK|nr:DNA-binding transcriptional regulator [Paraburkholderia caballeronis]PXW26480.1 AraC family transcriptional regulator [Paraburkholderia caballeronis]PXX02027.1 AraC family transcriptional regulator [Paraburkholderia caballeronis]RAK01184.1 AraC family transcriptional regulator [Paraburkholderia caballeronis]TDV16251.1 AraC family transcriptional regulator [Paraburkholderia caballeronis]TDV20601.1 AraC family transcriptional regulator [Paraburkholderia caballeronis]